MPSLKSPKPAGLEFIWMGHGSPMPLRGSAAARPRRAGAPVSTSCHSAPPRTAARYAMRSSCLRRSWSMGWRCNCAAPVRSGRRCVSRRRSSWPMSKAICGSSWRARQTRLPPISPEVSLAFRAPVSLPRSKPTRSSSNSPDGVMDALEADGFAFYRRSKTMARFVCRFDATDGRSRRATRRVAPASAATRSRCGVTSPLPASLLATRQPRLAGPRRATCRSRVCRGRARFLPRPVRPGRVCGSG